MNIHIKNKIFFIIMLLLAAVNLWVLPKFSLAAPNNSAIEYRTNAQNLYEILPDLSRLCECNIIKSPNLSNDKISGAWVSQNFHDFIAEFARDNKLLWGMEDGNLHLYNPQDIETMNFAFSTNRRAQTFLSLNSPKKYRGSLFKIENRINIDNSMTFSGPKWWLDKLTLNSEIINQTQSDIVILGGDSDVSLMIFKLTHSWAEDKIFSYGEQKIPVRGVASLMRDMLQLAQNEPKKILEGANKQEKLPRLPALEDNQNPNIPPNLSPNLSPQGQITTANQTNNAAINNDANDARITADARQNALIIKDKIENYYFYQNLIEVLDKSNLMVHIEAHIVDVNTTKLTETGIDWSISGQGNRVGFGAPSSANAINSLGINLTKLSALSKNSVIRNLDSVIANFRLLESTGDSKIISSPSVLTLDNNEAVFTTSDTFYVSVQGNSNAASSVVPVSATTLLKVTPHIIGDAANKRISVIVNIDDGAIDSSTTALVGGLPRVVQNRLTTQAIVDEGDGIAFGGRIYNTKVQSDNKVPFLGDLPILGYAFRNEKTENREYIRVYIIKPTIKAIK